jgi:glycosyltransferase involved in cell wall biosynthesis
MVDKVLRAAFLSTYPPRECGIATFTQDLVRELNKINGIDAVVAAINDEPHSYGPDVLFAFPQQNRESYAQAAEKLDDSGVDVLSVQHEYGIFGGEWGEYLLELLDRTKLPIVTTLHTVIFEPDDRQKRIIQVLCQKSAVVVVMANNSIPLLEQVYGVDSSKIKRIHHGVPRMDLPSRDALKKEMGLEGQAVVSTFGLISPGKGLEYGIEAIGQVTKKHRDILYLILGQTHPVVKRQFGEAYRSGLEKMVEDRGLEENIRFVNKYLTKEELIRYLKLSDIYMTPYLGKEQAVSGTLAYAVGCGRVIVSTPYAYAKEMLADRRGLFADFQNADSLANHINYLLEHPDEKKKMEERTLQVGKQMMWDHVAQQYADVFAAICGKDSEISGVASA